MLILYTAKSFLNLYFASRSPEITLVVNMDVGNCHALLKNYINLAV